MSLIEIKAVCDFFSSHKILEKPIKNIISDPSKLFYQPGLVLS